MSSWFQSPAPAPVAHQPRTRPRTRTRVYETVTSRVAQCVCSFLLTLLLIAGVIVFVLWLSLRPHRPRFHLDAFSVPGLAQPGAPPAFQFNVTDRNPNRKIGIYYDAMFGSVYYNNRLVGSGPVLFPFYQPPKNTTVVQGTLRPAAPEGDPVWAGFMADAAHGSVQLRLKLNSTIRFKVETWDTHHHHLYVDCDFVAGPDGNLLPLYKGESCPIYF
ncbi:Protein NDR1 [Ananas comosus]|uniref:Protein NDR1 n=1 Tax=Ananas comosus TaxID=4615 RepID=A0A199UJE0_ANACO|nr:Protein NDR1 [Ananas comosus]